MVKEIFSECAHMIKGVAGCALVFRNAIVSGRYFDRDLNKPLSGCSSGTMLSSAESVGGIFEMKSLESIAIQAQDHPMMVPGAGKNYPIATVIKNCSDSLKFHGLLSAIAVAEGESI